MYRTTHISPKNNNISTKSALGCEKVPLESNPIPYPEYLYLSISSFFVYSTAPNRQFSKVTPLLLVPEVNL